MNSDKKILICDKIEPEGVDLLKESGFTILENPTITSEELLEVISEVHVIVVRSRTKITESVINSGKILELICRPGTGIDNIDSSTAEKNNIPVFTSVEASTNAVAELTISLAVSLARSIPLADRSLKDNQWIKNSILGSELRGKTFGIIGLGRIGRRTGILASALEMKVIGFEKQIVDKDYLSKYNVTQVELNELLSKSDFISLHLPATPETIHMIGKEQFELMKNTSFLINTARGQLIVESDLFDALSNNKIAGAALDVFETEPPTNTDLIKLKNLIATPHIGAQIIEAQKEASIVIAQKIINFYLENKTTE
ncbi:MAG: hydroxyacid dehydrogenase [Thaumarchaeota archaeon]|nr:hydroxyacid dehydrogenase [Nitrososphaerota archaeon]NSL74599.1 hydroxyacid dehydrogenase [Nitrososphaerota archaeon]NSL75944.1 hydroxyacid dehydrogenase [Nitrososphaerota archaeon]